MVSRPLIWLTRPEADSAALAAELAHHGIISIIAPVLHIVPKPFLPPAAPCDALLLTSRHAAPALAQLSSAWHALPVYCVGAATAHIAVDLGFTHVIPGTSDVLALLPRLVSELGPDRDILYLAGEDLSVDVGKLLAVHSIRVTTEVIYGAIAEKALSDALRAALAAQEISGVVFFSKRSAEIAGNLLTAANMLDAVSRVEAFCISLPVAQTAGRLPWANLHSCHLPTRDALRDLIVSFAAKTL